MLLDPAPLKTGLACTCPKCGAGDLYKLGLSLTLRDRCETCGLDFSKNDSADGPAVFLVFIFGALLVPLALIVDHNFAPPLWVHAILWTIVVLGLTLGALRPVKAYTIALQYKRRPDDFRS